MNKRTPLYSAHEKAGAQFVDFAGWDMPLHYGSQIEEHKAVRSGAGMFDVSHMGVVDIMGTDSKRFLRYALANDIEKLEKPGKALYSCMLNENGGVIDDLIVYFMAENTYRIVLNAGTVETDVEWLKTLSKPFEVTIKKRPELSIIAVQGAAALLLMTSILSEPLAEKLKLLKPFTFFMGQDVMIARTGYTGEDGVEMIVTNELAPGLWQDLLNEQVRPCGLGARDTLRLEAGCNLYGTDMNQKTSPLISNLSWTVSFKDKTRDFVGRQALENEKARGISQKLVGLVMKERSGGVLRNHQKVFIDSADQIGNGEITSGSYSPTLNCSIALARVPIDTGNTVEIERRGKRITVDVVKPPFIKVEKEQ